MEHAVREPDAFPVRPGAVLSEIDELIRAELRLGKYLKRASRVTDDPREVGYLWSLSAECRDHARILSRHRRHIRREDFVRPSAPRWSRGKTPRPGHALRRAKEDSFELAREYAAIRPLSGDRYLGKFIEILADAHAENAFQLAEIEDRMQDLQED